MMGAMKLLHTADWHAGRTLHGQDRTPEIREVLAELAELALSEDVELIIVAGDLFDGRNPSADAEEAVFEFFVTTVQRGIPSVVIAGNHDSPARLDAFSRILKLANVHALGQVRVAGKGGVLELPLGDQLARVAALPFISERRIVKVAELLETDPGQWREKYQEGMRRLVANLSQGFDSEAVNLLVMHATMHGATLSNSEYQFHCTENYALSSDIFPEAVNYVALGHIHKAQAIEGLPENAGRYAGSVLQLDFGEQQESKRAFIVEANPGRPTELVKEYQIRAGNQLKRVRLDLAGLERRTSELERFDGWLKLTIKLDKPLPGLKDRIRQTLKNVLAIELELPGQQEETQRGVDLEQVSMVEAYALYYQEQKGQEVSQALKQAFKELFETHSETAEVLS